LSKFFLLKTVNHLRFAYNKAQELKEQGRIKEALDIAIYCL